MDKVEQTSHHHSEHMDTRSPEHGTINETKTQAFKKIAKYIEKVCIRLDRSSLVAHFPRIPETQVTQQQSRKHKVWKYKFTLVDVKQGESACRGGRRANIENYGGAVCVSAAQ